MPPTWLLFIAPTVFKTWKDIDDNSPRSNIRSPSMVLQRKLIAQNVIGKAKEEKKNRVQAREVMLLDS